MPDSILSLAFPVEDIAVLTISDPNKSVNVLSKHVLDDFERVFDQLADRKDLAGLILYSDKPGNFIAGADIREFVVNIDQTPEEVIQVCRHGQELFARLSKFPFVTVAAIAGICVGGGMEVAVWCDRRVMARDRKTSFAFPEVKLGIYPGWGGTARTPRIVGLSNAIELATGGEPIDAEAALAMGLAQVAPPDRLMDAAMEMVRSEQKSQQYLQDRKRWSAPLDISDTELQFLAATASAYIQGETKGHYPAPLAALEVMVGAARVDVETACKMEAEGFPGVFGTPVNRALMNVFFLRDNNKKQKGVEGVTPREIKSATVLGAGTMGQGIAAANVKRGIPVALGDLSPAAVGRGVQGILSEVSFDKKTRGPNAEKAFNYIPLVNGTVSDQELAGSDIVIEAIYENADAKRELFARFESQLADHAILCSNTSTIPITDLAQGLKRPEQFCGLHFFNPVRRMPLVEVIRGEKTSDETISTAVAYTMAIGKSPIVVNDGPGFLVNRVLLPYMNEALLLLEEGVSMKAVDRAATAFGMPMGPITLYDTVGLDVALHAGGVMQRAFPDRALGSKVLTEMVEANRLGKKNGRGFCDYGEGKHKDRGQPSPEVAALLKKLSRGSGEHSPEQLTDRLFLPTLLEATRLIEDGIVSDVRDVDLGLIYGIGFPPFKGGLFFWADTLGAKAIVERLKPYEELGKRYEPTSMLLEFAKSGRKFYDTNQ
ncbi:MAG: enoyl-CoA hydratase/isomerase family protein [Planctomycetales bacterium]|nr:enoyl-CoA hydratase/isomerase family protein [Planctomycetales bacterium]